MGETPSSIKCVECGSTDLFQDYDAGELVCEHCGVVISDTVINYGPEWRSFERDQWEKRSRVGLPATWTIPDKGLTTTIDHRNRDTYGRELNPEQKASVTRLRRWQKRASLSGNNERNLAFALSELSKVANKLNLPRNVVETASVIYRQFLEKRLTRGRSTQGIASASVYLACRQCNVIRTIEEVSKAANISKKECARNYRFLRRKTSSKVSPVDPVNYIAKLINQLSLSGETESVATKILDQATVIGMTSGRTPMGMAAAAIYLAGILTGERRSQCEIANYSQLTEVTIRNRYRELRRKLCMRVEL